MKLRNTLAASALVAAMSYSPGAAFGQSPLSVTINATNSGYRIPWDYTGLSFETGSELPNRNGVSGHLFSLTNTPFVTLFRNTGLHNLRVGGGTVDLPTTAIPGTAEIDSLFGFVGQVGNLDVIYSVRLLNGDSGDDSATPGDSYIANYIWQHYQPMLACLAIGNEPDWNSYHTSDPNITDYPTYLTDWRHFAAAIRSNAPGALFAAPDTGSYSTSTYYDGESWTQHFANDERASNVVALVTQHYYVGGDPGSTTVQQAIDNMLSAAWVTNSYPWLYSNNLAPVVADGLPYRLTESNDYLTGVTNASDSFASALWALDYMYWWAAHGCAGVNFHNKSWLYTDTIYLDPSGAYEVHPKAYGIKAFDLGGHGRVLPVTISNFNALNLTAYAVLGTNSLFVTIINKEHNAGARDASVTIAVNGFSAGSASAMFLVSPGGNAAATNGMTLGGATITNNVPWAGTWTPLTAASNGQCVVTVSATSAAVVWLKAAAPPPGISLVPSAGNNVVLTYSGTLISATNPTGPYAPVPGATSPSTLSSTNIRQFYRARSE